MQGLVTEEQRALCNIAWYMYTNKEVEVLLKSYEGMFRVESWDEVMSQIPEVSSSEAEAELVIKISNAVLEPSLSVNLESQLTSTLFRRLKSRSQRESSQQHFHLHTTHMFWPHRQSQVSGDLF